MRRRGYLRTIPAILVLVRQVVPGESDQHLWMVRQVPRMARARQAPVLGGTELDNAALYTRSGGIELRCRVCGQRARMRLRDLYARADRALAEGRAEIYA